MRSTILAGLFAVCCGAAGAQPMLPELSGRIKAVWAKVDKRALVWGSFATPSSVHPEQADNWKFEIYAKPELRIWQPHEKLSLSIYALVSAHKDRSQDPWNNKIRGGIGTELRYKISKAVSVSAGVRWDHEYQVLHQIYLTAPVATGDLSVWKTWDLDHLAVSPLRRSRLVLSGWGNIRYPASLAESERKNLLVQGSLKFALETPLGPSKFKIAPFLSVTAKRDTAQRDWNNTLEPAIGFAFKVPLGKRGELTLALRSQQHYRKLSGQRFSGTQFNAGFFKNF